MAFPSCLCCSLDFYTLVNGRQSAWLCRPLVSDTAPAALFRVSKLNVILILPVPKAANLYRLVSTHSCIIWMLKGKTVEL